MFVYDTIFMYKLILEVLYFLLVLNLIIIEKIFENENDAQIFVVEIFSLDDEFCVDVELRKSTLRLIRLYCFLTKLQCKKRILKRYVLPINDFNENF